MTRPIDDLLTFAERAYVRMQAEQLIRHCLEQNDTMPFNQLVQGLVLAGSSSLAVLREILDELRSTRSSLIDAGLGVRQDLIDALSDFGVNALELLSADAPEMFRQICSQDLRRKVRRATRDLSSEDDGLLQEICDEAGGRVATIARRLAMVGKLEASVRDWYESLAYEATRTPDLLPAEPPRNVPLQ